MSLTNSQYDAVMRMYHSIQIKNKHLLDQRVDKVYKACPEYRDIEDAIISLSMENAPIILQGNSSQLIQYKEQLSHLVLKKTALLESLGYPSDYLEGVYDCPLCKDTGYSYKKQCTCFKKKVIDMFYMQSNLKNIVENENFSTFSFQWYSNDAADSATGLTPYNNMQKVVGICKKFIEVFDSGSQNLLLYGNTGVGKTFLCNCIARELLETSHSVIYLTAIELFDTFANHDFSYEKNSDSETNSSYILDCDLLIIDDLGTELSNSFTNSKLFYCINERILKNKSTVISTNLSIKELASNYSERVFSRISSSYTTLKLHGTDIRIKKRNYAK